MLLKFARRFAGLGPLRLPGFIYGWLSLIQHRAFLPAILSMPNNEGWGPFSDLLCQLLDCIGEQLKTVNVSDVTKELYRATWKLLVVIQHDFPEFMFAHHIKLCGSIPPHCTQLINTILAASPQQNPEKLAEDEKAPSGSSEEATTILRDSGLLSMVDQAIQNGPSEDVVAQIAHAMTQNTRRDTAYGHSPVMVNARVVGAVVMHLGNHAAERAEQAGNHVNVSGGEPEVATLSMLVHEVSPVVRYYLLTSIANQLRAPSAQTEFFHQALLYIFGKDMNDPEETELRQDITRILLERLGGYWPQPWGLMTTIVELLKNEKYAFFELPFIKADPEVSTQFDSQSFRKA